MRKYVIQYSVGNELKLNIVTAQTVEEALILCGAVPDTKPGTKQSAHIEFIYSEEVHDILAIQDDDIEGCTKGIKN